MQLIPTLFRTNPSIPETDFSGTTIKTGPKVPFSRALVPGTAVFGSIPIGEHVSSGKGVLAEYVVVPAERVCLKPDNVSFEQAAGLPIAGTTALSVLNLAKLKHGYKVLVNGASGGIGCMAVQMAKDVVGESGKVVAVCSGRNLEMVKGLGADEVILLNSIDPFTFAESRWGRRLLITKTMLLFISIWRRGSAQNLSMSSWIVTGSRRSSSTA
jgi:NADPH:quinone reductase-like Zn-dependent oxidoreductase